MRLTVMVRTKRNNVCHSVCAIISQCNDVMTFQIGFIFIAYESSFITIFADPVGAFLYCFSDLWIARISHANKSRPIRVISTKIINSILRFFSIIVSNNFSGRINFAGNPIFSRIRNIYRSNVIEFTIAIKFFINRFIEIRISIFFVNRLFK